MYFIFHEIVRVEETHIKTLFNVILVKLGSLGPL